MLDKPKCTATPKALHQRTFQTLPVWNSRPRQSQFCIYITSLSVSLLAFGRQNGQKNKAAKRSLKFTISFASLRFAVKFHQQQRMISEDMALGDILQQHALGKNHIALFERGMKDRRRMAQVHDEGQYFVSRISKAANYELVKGNSPIGLDLATKSLALVWEKQVDAFDGKGKKVKTGFRLIEGIRLASGEPIRFLSHLPAYAFSSQQIDGRYKKPMVD